MDRARQHVAQMRRADLNKISGKVRSFTNNTWTYMGPTNLSVPYQTYYGITPINGRVNAVAFDPTTSSTIYAGGAQGGLWKSTDSGANWNWMSSLWTQLAVNCIAIDPNNSQTIYVGRGDYHGFLPGSYGIMKSTDGGNTWNEIAISSMGNVGVNKILIDPTNSQTLIAGTGDSSTYTGSLYRSTNAGQTWTKISLGGTYFIWPSIAASAPSGGSTRFYAVAAGYATGTGNTSRIYISDDHGVTWSLLASPVAADGNYRFAYEVATSPFNANNVYVLDSENARLYTSSNKGASWSNVSGNLPAGPSQDPNFSQSNYDYHLECGLNGVGGSDVLYLGEINVMFSTNGGGSWSDFVANGGSYSNGAVLHNDQHCLAVCPTDPTLTIFSNDGGVYSAKFNSGFTSATVSRLSKNLGNSMFYHIAMHPTNANYALGGTQDNASPLSTGDLGNWLNPGAGDGAGCAINQVNPLIQYNSYDNGGIYHTTDGWAHQNLIGNGSSTFLGNLAFVPTVVLDPSNQNLMYTGTSYLYRWNESTLSWSGPLGNQNLTNNGSGATVQGIAVAPTNTNRIYTGSSDGSLWMTSNQGTSWTHLNAAAGSLPTAAITSISVSPTSDTDILIGLSSSGSGISHIYRCTNTAAATPTFTAVAGSGSSKLPDISLNTIARDLNNPATTWWVGTDVGVFVSTDSGTTWSNGGSAYGLPNVIVDELVAVPGTGYLNAGTYGRGLWHLQIGNFSGVNLSALSLSPASVVAGTNSTGTVTLSAAAPAGGISVSLSSGTTSVATVPSSVLVASGSTTATFPITSVSAGTSVINASYNGTTRSQTLTVTALGVTSLTLSPTSVQGGTSSTGTVTLNGNAPTGGASVTLASNNAGAQVPATVSVAAGQSTATFTITTSGVASVTTATITATYGSSNQTAPLTINPATLQSITLAPTTVVGGSNSTATVTLSGPAGPSGTVVSLTSSSTSATVPTSMTVAAGASTGTFTVTTTSVTTATTATITGTLNSVSKTATLTINPADLSSVTLNPSTVTGGTNSTGTVTLAGPAGASGVTVNLTSQDPTNVTVPTSVTIASGASSATFTVTTLKSYRLSYTNTITATLGGTTKTATLTVQGDSVTSLTLNPSTIGGAGTSTGTVTLAGAAPAGGWVVNLSAANTSYATVQATVTVPAGSSSATFPITGFQRGGTVSTVITASDGGSTATATLTVTGDSLKSLTLTPSTIGGDQTSTGTVTLNSPAPVGGWVVTLKAGVASYASMPSSITIPAGSSTGTFTISSSQRASTVTFGIYANDVGSQVSALLTVTGDSILSFTLNPTTVGGNQTSTGTVTLKAAAPAGGWLVTLKCGVPADLSFPSSITIPEGQTVGTFTITPKQLASTIAIGIYANDVATNLSATLTVTGDSMASMVFNPTSIGGDQTSTATITLNSAAPTGGWIINLKSGAPTVASIPSSITIPAGSTTGTFTITGHHYSSNTNVLIIANDGVTALNSTISVLGDSIAGFTINPTTIGGNQTATGTVTLTSNAPPGGWLVNIKSGLPNTAAVPVSITIPQGSNTGTFTITAGQHPGSATIPIYVYDGISNRTVNITVLGDSLASVTLNPSTIGGNGSTTGTVTLTSPAPVGGWFVTFKPAVTAYATVTPSITIPAGQTTGTFTVTSSQRVATVTFNILASDGGSNQSASLTVVGDSITGMSLSPTTIGGNGTSTGTVTLSAAAPQGGWLVNLKSAVPSYVSVPASIVIPQGATSGTFVVTPKQLASNVTVGIYANDGATGANATITINGDSMASFTINPTTVKGGTGSTGTVTLNAPAPAGGWTITLKVGAPSLVGVPATVVVPAGATSVTFAITTKVVTSQTAVGIYASDGPTNLNQTITITP